MDDPTASASVARRVLSAALALYGTYLLAHLGEGSLLDSVDLAVHETGHLVFGPFGELIGFAGGTIMQLVMPGLFVGYFVRAGDNHAASVALWWVGQSCAHVSVYARCVSPCRSHPRLMSRAMSGVFRTAHPPKRCLRSRTRLISAADHQRDLLGALGRWAAQLALPACSSTPGL